MSSLLVFMRWKELGNVQIFKGKVCVVVGYDSTEGDGEERDVV